MAVLKDRTRLTGLLAHQIDRPLFGGRLETLEKVVLPLFRASHSPALRRFANKSA